MHGLTRTINAAVGIKLNNRLVFFILIIASTRKIDVLGWSKLILIGRNQHRSIHILEISLAVGIGGQAGMYQSLVLLCLHVIVHVIKFDFSPSDRLTTCSIHNDIAMLVVRQLLNHHRQVAHIEETSLWSDTCIVRRHLH